MAIIQSAGTLSRSYSHRMGSRQRSNLLLGSMDSPSAQIVRPRIPHTSAVVEQRSNAVSPSQNASQYT